MKFPVVIIKANEAPIYFFDSSDFGLISKGGESFYKNGVIYDSDGTKLLIRGVESIKKAPVLKSLKYFQPMYVVNVKSLAEEKLTLLSFKQVIVKHIRSFEKYWVKKDIIESLEASVLEKNNFSEIIKFLK